MLAFPQQSQFIGLLLISVAHGVLTVQAFLYYIAFPNDRDALRLKCVVWSVYIIELVQTAMITYSLFQQFVYGFLDITSLDRISCNWFSVPILGGTVTFIVQMFYVHRIALLGSFLGERRASVIAFFIAVVSMIQLGTGIAIGIQLLHSTFYTHIDINKILIYAALMYGAGTTCDITIAVCMTIILIKSSSSTLPRTRKIVRKLVRLTIEAGSLTAVMSIVTIILVVVPTYETYYQVTAPVMSKLYSNAMMAVLLNRAEYSNREASAEEHELSTLRFSGSRAEASSGRTLQD